MLMTVGGLLCQFIEVVNVENNFLLQIISCYILNKLYIFYLRIFEKQCNAPLLIYSDFILILRCWEKRGVTSSLIRRENLLLFHPKGSHQKLLKL